MSTITVGTYGMAELAEGGPPAVVEQWVVTTKLYHPLYTQFMVVLIHLEETPNLPVPELYRVDCTHAVSSVTINPEHPYTTTDDLHYLTPVNLEVQFRAEDDEGARRVLRGCVDEVLGGRLNPESGRASLYNTGEWTKYVEGIL